MQLLVPISTVLANPPGYEVHPDIKNWKVHPDIENWRFPEYEVPDGEHWTPMIREDRTLPLKMVPILKTLDLMVPEAIQEMVLMEAGKGIGLLHY